MGRRFGPNFDIVHAQQIAMFSYLTGSLDYALSNRIFILYERITRFVAEYIMANSHKKFYFYFSYHIFLCSFSFFLSFFLLENFTRGKIDRIVKEATN